MPLYTPRERALYAKPCRGESKRKKREILYSSYESSLRKSFVTCFKVTRLYYPCFLWMQSKLLKHVTFIAHVIVYVLCSPSREAIALIRFFHYWYLPLLVSELKLYDVWFSYAQKVISDFLERFTTLQIIANKMMMISFELNKCYHKRYFL